MSAVLVTICSLSTTSTSGSPMALLRMHDMSNPYTERQTAQRSEGGTIDIRPLKHVQPHIQCRMRSGMKRDMRAVQRHTCIAMQSTR